MQCVVYWNGNTLFFTICPLWNDISWWRNTQDPESEWFTKSWWMTDLRFLFCSLVTIGYSRDTCDLCFVILILSHSPPPGSSHACWCSVYEGCDSAWRWRCQKTHWREGAVSPQQCSVPSSSSRHQAEGRRVSAPLRGSIGLSWTLALALA